ncbi:MAG TPA: BREX system P-loop protein BrxC [Candidatus Atribacteria bacterium]|uniref:BREX system P-loop protein BrxC n=1 Tax=candidate division TA06 bacterium 34_109 TaxID=1635277 RepID=A0A117M5W1_UNCT6|nr:MAG: hypothetical protein XE03_1737 [candidate division TA06 bacterium 34_109]HBY56386.1 BREX system P-loop protein BrxC [Candidatus Atribacteria bacterium]
MDKIKDILLLDFSKDIKDVINVEDQSDLEVQYEVENYIITEKIADFFERFIREYQSNIKETGVWISGFYGSGKSYFGKMLGYLLENKIINGTPFRERFIQRLKGLENKDLLENTIRSLDAYQSKVIFLDIAKQHTGNSFAWTLFSNFLKRLGFLDDVFGYMEYLLFIKGDYSKYLENVKSLTGYEWKELRKNFINVPKTMRQVLVDSGYFSVDDYNVTKETLDNRIRSFNPDRLAEELNQYLVKFPDERIVFIIDELSEAINIEKINLLELEGISESLSSLPKSRVWTIAIAQEYLDQVINSVKYISHREVNKVIDRFRLKIPLSSDDLETIIKERLLQKSPTGIRKLEEVFNQNNGAIIDFTSLKSKVNTKSDTPDKFITYYPFHKYQINLLQNFIQSVYSKTNVTERGLIIAIFAVLKNLNNENLFNFATAFNLVDGAKQNIDSDLAKKFSNAEKILRNNQNYSISGSRLLKVIYFINESLLIDANAENITKLYSNKFHGYYELKPKIEKALNILSEENLLLNKNNSYTITSNLEQDKIEEMKNIDVPLYNKKSEFIEYLKKQEFIKNLSRSYFESKNYTFSIMTRQGDELFKNTKNDELKIQIESIYSIDEEQLAKYINQIKYQTKDDKDTAILIPSLDRFKEIDKKITEIYQYNVMENRYQNDNDEKLRMIIRDFSQNKENTKNELDQLINEAYEKGILIYDFKEILLNKDDFENTFKRIKERMISNTFTERLPVQLTEDMALKVLKAENPQSLILSLPDNAEVRFFDSNGNFIGDGLRVIENLNNELSSAYISGIDLEDKFGKIPYGYDYETILVAITSLIRAGRVAVKYNGRNIYDYHDNDLYILFSKSREFRKASFKSISSNITAVQKQELVEKLKNLHAEKVLDIHFDYNSNDLELARIVKELSDYYLNQVNLYKKYNEDFSNFFPEIEEALEILREHSQSVTSDNFKDNIENFLKHYPQYEKSVINIQRTINFCERDLDNVKKYQKFVNLVIQELYKISNAEYQLSDIFQLAEVFNEKCLTSIYEHFSELKEIFQKIKDKYYQLMEKEHQDMASLYQKLNKDAQDCRNQIVSISEDLNEEILKKIDNIIDFADRYHCGSLEINFETRCENCHYSLNEIIFANQTMENKFKEIEAAKTQIKYPVKGTPKKEVRIKMEKGKFSVSQYKRMLQEKIKEADSLNNDDIIIVE